MKSRLNMVCLAVALSGCATMSKERLPAGSIESPFASGNSHITFPVRVGGHTYEAVYDSGAEVSLMSAAIAKELGLHPQPAEAGHGFGGDIQSGQLSGVRVEVGAGEYTFPQLIVVDFTPMVGPGGHLDFILGPTLLPDHVVDIDPASHLMRWTPRESFHAPANAVAVALGHQGGTFTMPMKVKDVEGVAGIDFGSGTSIALSADFAKKLGLNPNEGATRQGMGVGGQFQSRVTSVPAITIAGVEMHDVSAEIVEGALPTGAEINVGTPILFRFRIMLDYAGQRGWLIPIKP